jgi:hypothetical protein
MRRLITKSTSIFSLKVAVIRARLSRNHLSDEQLLESLDGFADLQDALDYIRNERPRFFIKLSLKEKLVSLVKTELPRRTHEIVEEADKICSHVFDVLGSGDVNLDEFVETNGGGEQCGYLPWHFDFKTGYRWSARKFYKEIKIPYGKGDIKVPWELSRFQDVTFLGQAYWVTDDEKYAEEFVKEVEDWIDRNAPKFGVNWRCTMDVAIRVANWIWGYYFFKDSDAITDKFLAKFLKSLLAHGRHIMANLENKGVTTNHYLSDIVGLIYLGICFPEFKEAKHWREFGIQELIKEMDKQVYDDGMDFEASTCYHRLALELFFYPALLCQLNDIKLPQTFLDKLRKMFDFVLYVLKPNGRMPQIGDNDNGRLHILGQRDILDMTYLLTFATLFFDDPKYKIEEFGFAPEALWLFGPEVYERWQDMPGRSVEELESKAFPDGGIYVMRHKKDYMVISCGPNGQNGNGGHAHNDKLSFELSIDGEDIIVDPGTYVYTADPASRNKFRSTAYHNTVVVDDVEQQDFDGVFAMSKNSYRALPSVDIWKTNRHFDVFEGEFPGYSRLEDPVVQKRLIYFDKDDNFWLVSDLLEANDEQHRYDQYMHLGQVSVKQAGIRLDRDKLTEFLQKAAQNTALLLGLSPFRDTVLAQRAIQIESGTGRVFVVRLPEKSLKHQTLEGWISPEYGSKQRSPVLRLSGRDISSTRYVTLILPIKDRDHELRVG